MKIPLIHPPQKIKVMDSASLMIHSDIMLSRAKAYSIVENELTQASINVDKAKLDLRRAELAEAKIQIKLDALRIEEMSLKDSFFMQVRSTHPNIRQLSERYGKGVTFLFDSDSHTVWIIALFSNDAPPILSEDYEIEAEEYEEPNRETETGGG